MTSTPKITASEPVQPQSADALPTILVADDHPLFREALAKLATDIFPEADIGEATCMEEVFAIADVDEPPSLFLLDLLFPSMDLSVSLPRLRRKCPRSSIIIVSMIDDEERIAQVMRSGADGFINKAVPSQRCAAAIMRVLAGEYVVERADEAAGQRAIMTHGAGIELTPRQQEIVSALSRHLSNKEIARELDISPFTVRSHVSALMRLLGVTRRGELKEKALALGLLDAT
ncbi:MAG: response regulator transcription factor [Sphingopyxis sp.]|uniref:response regulator transcription factor n=1 Tax=Sphingopyxis sp. TaxID=1908224 RepID=UPI002AB9B4D9|nr:response regulator transcription factor [Sphingopyxis sp.]MDZ3832214.1 response regulator transcription factor [Sphingopyxis sp.]